MILKIIFNNKKNYAMNMRTSLIFKGRGIKLLPRNTTLYTLRAEAM